MGADLLLAVTALPFDVEPDWHAARKYIWACETVEALDPQDWYYESDLDTVQRDLQNRLTSFSAVIDGKEWARDLTALYAGGHRLYITGGMSWGDSPTDTFEELNLLAQSGALRAAGFDPDGYWTGPGEAA